MLTMPAARNSSVTQSHDLTRRMSAKHSKNTLVYDSGRIASYHIRGRVSK